MSSPNEPPARSRYREHLAQGLSAYAERSGRKPPAESVDVGRPAVRALYDRFRARPFPRTLGATDAEWLQLNLGLKDVLRERLNDARLEALRLRCARDGWALHVEPLPAPAEPEALDGADTSPLRAWHAYVGRDAALVQEAAALDASMSPHQSAIKLDAPGTAADSRRLGELLGYPPCCTAAFARWHDGLVDNWQPIASAAEASERFDPLLNNLALGSFHLIAWFPCRYDCAASLGIARRLADELESSRPAAFAAATRALALPRIYMDERRQLLFEGEVVGDTVRYRDVFTPYALDRQAITAAYEWVFFADVVATLALGDTAWLDSGSLVVARGDQEVTRIPAPEAIWLPFGP